MIRWVFEGAQKAQLLERIIIATDDNRIADAARKFGAEVVMTSSHHSSGTERVAEIASTLDTPIIINIQGDEPLIHGKMIDFLVEALQDENLPMATLIRRQTDQDRIHDKNEVKVVIDHSGNALYFSRAPIPFQAQDYYFYHIGIYGYQRDFLIKFSKLPPSRLEKTEKLEQLRALEYGHKIKTVEIPFITQGVDTPGDIKRVEKLLEQIQND